MVSTFIVEYKFKNQLQPNIPLDNFEQDEWYRLLVESIQDYAIFLLDTSGNVISWNDCANKFLGYKSADIKGKNFSLFYTKADILDGKPKRELRQARLQGRVEDEHWRVRKDNSRFWAMVVITPLYNQSGQLQGYANVTCDRSEDKRIKDALTKSNKLLKQQQKDLLRLNRAKDEFISIASHQLCTPATIVNQYLCLLLDGHAGPLPAIERDYIEKAKQSNDRQLRTANLLLQIAQIDAGKVTLHKKPTNLTPLINEIMDDHADIFKLNNLKVHVDIAKAKHVAEIDPDRFRMAVENLINNARKYTPEGGEVRITVCDKGSNYVKVVISDTGVGIKNEDLAKLFKRFSRIPNKLSATVGGTGLGLYWASKVIRLHSGHINVESKEGIGSTFEIIVPKGAINA